MLSPWWVGLDLRTLRHVRGVLRRRELELTLVEHRPRETAAFAPLSLDEPTGAGLAVIAPGLVEAELGWIENMLGEAALDVSTALRERDAPPERANGRRTTYAGIIGSAPAMQELYGLLDRVAPSESTVLIQGENGTGKELVARAIPITARRAARSASWSRTARRSTTTSSTPSCSATRAARSPARRTTSPACSRSRGHGARSSSTRSATCRPALQVKVLRVLQDGTFTRVGDTETRQGRRPHHRGDESGDLRAMVADGRFREDLFYRINVINVMLPSLRERRDDVPVARRLFSRLASAAAARPSSSTPSRGARMLAYPWPGNVRELENEIERLVVLAGDAPR